MDFQNVQPGLEMGEESPWSHTLSPQPERLQELSITDLLIGGWEFNFSVDASWAKQCRIQDINPISSHDNLIREKES